MWGKPVFLVIWIVECSHFWYHSHVPIFFGCPNSQEGRNLGKPCMSSFTLSSPNTGYNHQIICSYPFNSDVDFWLDGRKMLISIRTPQSQVTPAEIPSVTVIHWMWKISRQVPLLFLTGRVRTGVQQSNRGTLGDMGSICSNRRTDRNLNITWSCVWRCQK